MKNLSRLWIRIVMAAFAVASLPACLSNGSMPSAKPTPKSSASSKNITQAALQYNISNIQLAQSQSSSTTAGTAPNIARIYFDSTSPGGAVTQSCTSSGSSAQNSLPCVCQFSWKEVNHTGGDVVAVSRLVTTDVSLTQPNLVECPLPAVYATEIADGTVMQVSVLAGPGNLSVFLVPPFNLTKPNAAAKYDFQDFEGKGFNNVHRYSCYEQIQGTNELYSRKRKVLNSQTQNSFAVFAASNQFCIGGIDGATADECPELSAGSSFSSQAYYYNMFVRSSELGAINFENQRYKCPRVKESLKGGGTVGTQADFWPLDSTFALAVSSSSEFPVGVEAYSKLGSSTGGAGATETTCYPTNTTPGNSGTGDFGRVSTCLGFAAKPNPDNTCPNIKDSNGQPRMTYRLRRFFTLYPSRYKATGAMLTGDLPVDTIYVLDRPVNAPGMDPLKPYTMQGPKPCPFALYDPKGVSYPSGHPDAGIPRYTGTSSAYWAGKNPDGLEFPNLDKSQASCTAGSPCSCSVTFPILSQDKSVFTMSTLNAMNPNPALRRKFVRPMDSWAPHYIEDIEFKACAPMSLPFKDPPLHFAKDAQGNVGWCAEVYPSQNTNIADLEKRQGSSPTGAFTSKVAPFTSHVVKNTSSAACNFSSLKAYIPTSGYPAAMTWGSCAPAFRSDRAAHHPSDYLVDSFAIQGGATCISGGSTSTDAGGTLSCNYCAHQTCDRTVQTANLAWHRFPLLAPPSDVERTLSSDPSYLCSVTYDNGSGKAGIMTPSEGCCGASVQVWTGLSGSTAQANRSAHLEPDQACQTPKY